MRSRNFFTPDFSVGSHEVCGTYGCIASTTAGAVATDFGVGSGAPQLAGAIRRLPTSAPRTVATAPRAITRTGRFDRARDVAGALGMLGSSWLIGARRRRGWGGVQTFIGRRSPRVEFRPYAHGVSHVPQPQVHPAGPGPFSEPEPGLVTLHVWGVPARHVPTAIGRMAVDRVLVRRAPGARFAKLLGTADGRTFATRDTDPLHWGLLVAWDHP